MKMEYKYVVIKETNERKLVEFKHSFIDGEWWYQIDGYLYAESSLIWI
jgi:hypothetical protein